MSDDSDLDRATGFLSDDAADKGTRPAIVVPDAAD